MDFISVYIYIWLTYNIVIICYKYYIFVQADMCALSAYITTSLSYWTVENLTTLSAMTYWSILIRFLAVSLIDSWYDIFCDKQPLKSMIGLAFLNNFSQNALNCTASYS